MNKILEQFILLSKEIITSFNKYKENKIDEESLIKIVQELEPKVLDLYLSSTDDENNQEIYAIIHDMTLYYSKKGLENWDKENRDWLMNNTINRLNEAFTNIKLKKIKTTV